MLCEKLPFTHCAFLEYSVLRVRRQILSGIGLFRNRTTMSIWSVVFFSHVEEIIVFLSMSIVRNRILLRDRIAISKSSVVFYGSDRNVGERIV